MSTNQVAVVETDAVVATMNRARAALAEAKTIQELPREPGVYVLRHREEVLYVGESTNLRLRWMAHELRAFIALPGVSLSYARSEDHKHEEGRLIAELRPSMNGMRPCDRRLKRLAIETGRSFYDVCSEAIGADGLRALGALKHAAAELGLSL